VQRQWRYTSIPFLFHFKEALAEMHSERPLPKPNADTIPFWDGCRNHELKFQKCKDCGHVRWPPSIFCPKCYSQDGEWTVASGMGKIFSYAVYHQAFHPAFKQQLPYVVAVVVLEEGPHILSNIIDCSHDRLRCDMEGCLAWEDVSEEMSLPKFRPVQKNRQNDGR
jgi:uncharacterized OB-fold protein